MNIVVATPKTAGGTALLFVMINYNSVPSTVLSSCPSVMYIFGSAPAKVTIYPCKHREIPCLALHVSEETVCLFTNIISNIISLRAANLPQ